MANVEKKDKEIVNNHENEGKIRAIPELSWGHAKCNYSSQE